MKSFEMMSKVAWLAKLQQRRNTETQTSLLPLQMNRVRSCPLTTGRPTTDGIDLLVVIEELVRYPEVVVVKGTGVESLLHMSR